MRKFCTSSSSTAKSEWRVTRNWENWSTVRPANNSDRCARMTLVSATNPTLVPETLSGKRMMRGNTRGTLTMAISLLRPKASLPPRRTIKFKALLATCGKGCAGSKPTGIKSGRTSRSKYCFTHKRCSASRSPCDKILIPQCASAGRMASLYSPYCRSTKACKDSDKRSKDFSV